MILVLSEKSISAPAKASATTATSTSYNMAAWALADLSHKGAKCPSAINQLSAQAAML